MAHRRLARTLELVLDLLHLSVNVFIVQLLHALRPVLDPLGLKIMLSRITFFKLQFFVSSIPEFFPFFIVLRMLFGIFLVVLELHSQLFHGPINFFTAPGGLGTIERCFFGVSSFNVIQLDTRRWNIAPIKEWRWAAIRPPPYSTAFR